MRSDLEPPSGPDPRGVVEGWPFDGAEAKRRQEEAAKKFDKPVELEVKIADGVNMAFILIPAGEFMMGAADGEECADNDERPRHRVRITKPFYLAKHECTQGEWQAVTGENPSRFKGDSRLPVEQVSWDDITQKFLPAIQGKAPRGMRFTLPTEAQWEYACRAGTATPFHLGATLSTAQANYDGNSIYGNGRKGEYRQKTTIVGSFEANAWGLHDMPGNVWEWCQDVYDGAYYRKSGSDDPASSAGSANRVLRGGSWDCSPLHHRSAFRLGLEPAFRGAGLGVRLCLDFP